LRIIGFMLMCIVGAIVVSNSSNWVLASEPSFSIVRQGAESKFPEGVRFFLEVNSIEPITDIRVYFEKMGQSSRRSYRSLEFEEGTSVSAEFLMRSGSGGQYIPPGTRIEYFFEIYDDAGEANQTEEVTFIYLDPQFQWKTLTDGLITVFFDDESMTDVGRTILETASTTLEYMRPVLGIDPEEPLHIVTYENYRDMSKALPFRSEATSKHLITQGMAFREERVLLVHGQSDSVVGTTSHEFTHLLLADAAGRAIQRVPTWLNEGLAEYGNQHSSGEYARYLQYAIKNGKLKPLWHLGTFSGSPGEILLGYGQGQSVVEYLVSTYGQNKMAELIQSIKSTFDIDAGLKLTYGFDQHGLDSEWRRSLGVDPLPSPKKKIPEEPQQGVALPTIIAPVLKPTIPPSVVPTPVDKVLPTVDIDSTNNNYRNDPIASTGKDEKPKGTTAPGCSIIYNSPVVQSDVSTLTLLGGALSLFGFVVWRKRG